MTLADVNAAVAETLDAMAARMAQAVSTDALEFVHGGAGHLRAVCRECNGTVHCWWQRACEAARWHRDGCEHTKFRADMLRRGCVAVTIRHALYRAAGVESHEPPWAAYLRQRRSTCREERFVPEWAWNVARAKAPYHRRLRVMRLLARDPVAAQLVASHPHTLPALLAARTT